MTFYINYVMQNVFDILQKQQFWKMSEAFKGYTSVFFVGLIWGRILAPSQLNNEQKLAKMVYIIPNF